MKCAEQANPQRQKVDWWLPRGVEVRWKWGVITIEYDVSFHGDQNVLKLTVVMVTQL